MASNNPATITCEKVWKCAKEWISDLKFSPDDTRLGKLIYYPFQLTFCKAIGSHDNAIYVYKVGEWKL